MMLCPVALGYPRWDLKLCCWGSWDTAVPNIRDLSGLYEGWHASVTAG
jgi:hypothetical protein